MSADPPPQPSAAPPAASFPELFHARPEWPNRDDEHLFWVGLNTRFVYSHHPVKPAEPAGAASPGPSFFCRPKQAANQLISVLQHSSGGGSILITGYRGTGKTSLVNHCLDDLKLKNRTILRPRVNMATVANAHDVLLLTYDALLKSLDDVEKGPQDEIERLKCRQLKWRVLIKKKYLLRRWKGRIKQLAARSAAAMRSALSDKGGFFVRLRQKITGLKPAKSGAPCSTKQERLAERIKLLELRRDDLTKLKIRLANAHRDLRSSRQVEQSSGVRLNQFPPDYDDAPKRPGVSSEQTFEREALSRFQADLVNELKLLAQAPLPVHAIFVFDEVDKLMPVDDWVDDKPEDVSREIKKLASFQQMVAELKHFLSESPSHQIFIAGKDVDDSWAEDQNRGEGIFESIFASNINVASIFTLELEPCLEPLPEAIQKGDAEGFYAVLAGEMGIPRNSLVFRTALLILPHLAEYEIVQLLTRAYLRQPELDPSKRQKIKQWLEAYHSVLKLPADDAEKSEPPAEPDPDRSSKAKVDRWWDQPCLGAINKDDTLPPGETSTIWFDLAPMSERTCRRLRIFMEYLTYKGRGIPRKVLREFYAMVRPATCVPNDDPGFRKLWGASFERYKKPTPEDYKHLLRVRHVLAFPQHHLQKMNFYAGIVEHLDRNFALLRGLNDKGRVSIFHIIDYLLKFYATGFSHRDLEHAPFMTAREELFPSRQLAALILRIMDGKLWKRKDSRSAEYRMLHHVAHDLGVMFLRYGPEQMELRHTMKDFRDETPRLDAALKNISGMPADQRLAPIHAQLRRARIMELCGRHYEARLGYYSALRWLRLDVSHFEQAGANVSHTQAQTTTETQEIKPRRNRLILPDDSVPQTESAMLADSMGPLAHTPGFPVAFVSYTVETHVALGRLLEEVGELRAALHHYEEACALCEPYFNHVRPSHVRPHGDTRAPVNPNKKDKVPTFMHYGTRLWDTLFEEASIPQTLAQSHSVVGKVYDAQRLAHLLHRKPPIQPLKLAGMPQGYVQVCNHAAISYSKLWERSSANAYLLRALIHLDEIGDEYGLVEQMFFIGQVMVRRRDMVAATFWYRAALIKCRAIRQHSSFAQDIDPNKLRETQTGAGWQTPPVVTTLEAQIAAALGDVTFATGGYAFHAVKPGSDAFAAATTDEEARLSVWNFICNELDQEVLLVDDRWEEYFFTQARRLFEAGDQDIEARDVYLRQLESRFCRFEQAIGHPHKTSVPELALIQYTTLNAWTTFWRGARVLLHRNLIAVTSLARDKQHTWGRISDFRRMGTNLRLIGSMLMELGLRANDAPSRSLLVKSSEKMQEKGFPIKLAKAPPNAPVQFYQRFLGTSKEHDKTNSFNWKNIQAAWKQERAKGAPAWAEERAEDTPENRQLDKEDFLPRVNVNLAATDILTIFAYIGDRSALLKPTLGTVADNETSGGRSALYRVNGDREMLPIAKLLSLLKPADAQPAEPDSADGIDCRFKLLMLAEKALLSSYLCYRDCIPDFSYAQSCVKMGELYAAALFKLGEWTRDNNQSAAGRQVNLAKAKEIASAISGLTEHAKRFLAKAIDILNREQEQNRNNFHLMSEAWFNLADIAVISLLAITGSTPTLQSRLFGDVDLAKAITAEFKKQRSLQEDETAEKGRKNSQNAKHLMRDSEPEDLRRQITDAYQNGLRYVQAEMNDFQSRYRVPGDVFYASRNLMDPVLHFRICRSVRLRHSGAQHDSKGPDYIRDRFERLAHTICDPISGYESPQLSADHAPSKAWAAKLKELVTFANEVRTDRGPLVCAPKSNPVSVDWLSGDMLSDGEKFVFFSGKSQ